MQIKSPYFRIARLKQNLRKGLKTRKHKFIRKQKPHSSFLVFSRKKGEKSILTTPYMKFVNYIMRKGFKDRYLKMFFSLVRIYKERIKSILNWKFQTNDFNVLSLKIVIPSFFSLLGKVFRKITLRLELKRRTFKKAEIMCPTLMAPWRGFRLGINLLFQKAKSRLDPIKRHRKIDYLYKLFSEIWDTYYSESETSKSVLEFTDTVLKSTEFHRKVNPFDVWKRRRKVLYVGTRRKNHIRKKEEDGLLTRFDRFKKYKIAKSMCSTRSIFSDIEMLDIISAKISDKIKRSEHWVRKQNFPLTKMQKKVREKTRKKLMLKTLNKHSSTYRSVFKDTDTKFGERRNKKIQNTFGKMFFKQFLKSKDARFHPLFFKIKRENRILFRSTDIRSKTFKRLILNCTALRDFLKGRKAILRELYSADSPRNKVKLEKLHRYLNRTKKVNRMVNVKGTNMGRRRKKDTHKEGKGGIREKTNSKVLRTKMGIKASYKRRRSAKKNKLKS